MNKLIGWSALILAALSAPLANAAHTRATLLLSDGVAKAGDTVLAGVRLRMDPGWHTYWSNPGAAGSATKIVWQLPPGVTAGQIQWPLPEKLGPEDLTTYVYEGETVLLIPLKLAPDLKPGPLELKALVSWLECQELCVPGKEGVTATIQIGPETKPSADAPMLERWQRKPPKSGQGLSPRGWWEKAASSENMRPLILEWSVPSPATNADFYPGANDQIEAQPATERVSAPAGLMGIRKQVKKFEGDWPKEMSGVLVLRSANGVDAYEINLTVSDRAPESGPGGGTTSPFQWSALLSALGFAFLGGLILNVMPCVLPVIALKIFSFIKQSGQQAREARRLSLIYALGILASFLALAGFLIGLREAGHVASWGSQMQERNFLLGMTILITLVTLNLFGAFEVTLSGRALDAADSLSGKGGAAGAFFNGVLATALAIPCTAPFLTVALAFAFAQPPRIIVLIFCFIALGLSAPYLALTWYPALLKFLPKPGAWMARFKTALGFPMLATVFWLYRLCLNQLSKTQSFWFGMLLVTLALSAWIWGEFVQRGSRGRGLAGIISIALLASVGAYAGTRRDGLQWQAWSQTAIAQARAAGRPVLVDFTADWCLTCQLNMRTSIDVRKTREKLADVHAVTLIADYTLPNDAIGRELHEFGRDAVPLVVVYPAKTNEAPIVLPPVLKPQLVCDALDRAAK